MERSEILSPHTSLFSCYPSTSSSPAGEKPQKRQETLETRVAAAQVGGRGRTTIWPVTARVVTEWRPWLDRKSVDPLRTRHQQGCGWRDCRHGPHGPDGFLKFLSDCRFRIRGAPYAITAGSRRRCGSKQVRHGRTAGWSSPTIVAGRWISIGSAGASTRCCELPRCPR